MAQKLLEIAPHLTPDDVRSTSSGANGKDILFSQAARRSFPFAIECKNHRAFSVYKHYEQAKANAEGSDIPVLIIKQDRSEPMALLSFEHFLEIINGNQKSNKNK